MKNKKFNKFIIFILIFSMILPSFINIVYAVDGDAYLQAVVSSKCFKKIKYEYQQDEVDTSHTVTVLNLPSGSHGDIEVKESNGVYTLKDSAGDSYSLSMVASDASANAGGTIYLQDGKYYNAINGKLSDTSGVDMTFTLKDKSGNVIATKTVAIENIYSEEIKTEKPEGFFESLWGWITDAGRKVIELLENLLVQLLLALGDGIVNFVNSVVGENVTIDRLVFGKINKVSIDFWDTNVTEANGNTTVASVMAKVVKVWYATFVNIAILVYLIVLVYVGLKILLASTGKDKEKYMAMIKCWIMGLMILALFPYAMKYIIKINQAMVDYIASSYESLPDDDKDLGIRENVDILDLSSFFGSSEFPLKMMGGETPNKNNMMMYVRYLASQRAKLALVFVYYIMIFQTVAVLVMYYQRVFMVAFLITIFPLVAMTYTIDKLRR